MNAPSVLARLSGAARREAGFIATSRVMLLALVVVPFCAIAIVAAMLSQGALQALPVAVVDNARTSESQALVRLLSGRPEVRIATQPVSDAAAEAAMRRGQIWAFVSIPHGFGQPRAADEPIRLYYNAAYLSVGSTVERSLATALFVARLFPNARVALLLLIPTSLPIFFLSGATWPREAMPGWVLALGALLPSTHASRALLLVDQMGAPLSEALWPLAALALIAAGCLAGVGQGWQTKA